MHADTAAITRRSSTNRSAVTNNPLRRADGRTANGRRVRDLYRAFTANSDNPSDAFRAAALAAAELTTAAENARTELLAGQGNIDEIVRLENLAARAVRRLGLKATTAPRGQTLGEYLAKRAEEGAGAKKGVAAK